MAFWSKWFAPACAECGEKMLDEKKVFDDREVCPPCHAKLVQAQAEKEAELEARRIAEEEARKRFEDKKAFGGDDRYGE
ncbi:MAG: hypothetical protein EP330_18360 [Deltaproteobacteria bacterium]|nr:MAG: hypothetical protein EP330_18360 [Deltaproteobacteria bacterium]